MGIEASEGKGLVICRAINLSSFVCNMLDDTETPVLLQEVLVSEYNVLCYVDARK